MSSVQQSLAAPAPVITPPVILSSAAEDFSTLPLIYTFDDIASNLYQLDSMGIPNAFLQMAFNKMFIPPSMLTAAVMDHIGYNQNLKYHKYFGNGAGKYSLNELIFPDELALSKSEFWQAYRKWLAVIDVIADMRVADSWKAHHSKMITHIHSRLGFKLGANTTGSSGRNLCLHLT